MVSSSALQIRSVRIGERTPRLATFPNIPNLWERLLEAGEEGDRALPPHLIIKYERIVVERQSDRADHQVLVQALVPNAVNKIVAGRTLAVVLTTEWTARILRSSQQPEEIDKDAQILGTLQQHVKGIHPRLALVACAGPSTVRTSDL